MTYSENFKLMIWDKVIFGVIIAIAIYIGSINMEKIKIKENFKSELNKARIVKIAEVWEKANIYESNFYKLYNAVEHEKILKKFKKEKLLEKEKLTQYIKNVDKSRIALMEILHKNSFYLGHSLEKQVFEFCRALAVINIYQKINLDKDLVRITGSISSASLAKAKIEVDRFRANISQIRNYIIEDNK